MVSKGITIGLVGLLVLALVGGSAYILFRPREESLAQSAVGYNRGDSAGGQQGNGSQGQGQNQPAVAAGQRGQGVGGGNGAGLGRQEETEPYSKELADHPSASWITLRGTVAMLDGDTVTVQTDEESVDVHLGPEWYWEMEGIAISEGDEVAVTGFYEDNAFELAQVEDLTTGETASLRDQTGRPLWAGRGNGRQRATLES